MACQRARAPKTTSDPNVLLASWNISLALSIKSLNILQRLPSHPKRPTPNATHIIPMDADAAPTAAAAEVSMPLVRRACLVL